MELKSKVIWSGKFAELIKKVQRVGSSEIHEAKK